MAVLSNMRGLNRRSLLAGAAGAVALPASTDEHVYLFATDNYEIRMTLEFHDNDADIGLRFQDRSAHRPFCLSDQGEENRNCLSDFTGAIAIARYRIRSYALSEASLSLREYVRSIDQSEHVPARSPFERIIEIRGGRASDIQVFGYHGKAAGPDDAWYLLRQDLFLRDKTAPFLVLHWKHTLNAIRVLDIIPGVGTRQQEGGRARKALTR